MNGAAVVHFISTKAQQESELSQRCLPTTRISFGTPKAVTLCSSPKFIYCRASDAMPFGNIGAVDWIDSRPARTGHIAGDSSVGGG